MFLVKLMIPANLSQIFATLLPLLAFDFFQIGAINEPIFKFSELELEALSPSFDDVGYS